ncbi:MAG TPA: Rpn family recombination-promoting nuclease/putative transposase [Leptolyngbyaceae cyanobacterium M33_DOE_097]|nr:Rpn family recombination-promoting nuclease/putative transposase [Leptolyngbyaceae cyanobacterium M33_DOE_097]
MRRDSIFFRLFQQSPQLLFDLLPTAPANAAAYRFDSVAVKEPRFEIDGVFLPPDDDPTGTVFFVEVQFQKDERLCERLFGEAFLYFYRNRERFADWQAVILYPSRTLEQPNVYPYRALLTSDQVHCIYLDEVGDIRQVPLGVALMLLTTVEESQAPEAARFLLARAQQEAIETRRGIIEMITTIIVYKFGQLSCLEVETMLGLRLQETRVYQEAQTDEALRLVIRLLTRQLKQDLPEPIQTQIQALPLPLLESLGEALLDFRQLSDLHDWLQHHSPQP